MPGFLGFVARRRVDSEADSFSFAGVSYMG